MSVNNDSVTRSAYYKYLHPKEVFIADGVLIPDIIRKKVSCGLIFYDLVVDNIFSRTLSNLEVQRKDPTANQIQKQI